MTADPTAKPLPPHKGRVATLDILRLPVATHAVSDFTTPHPCRAEALPLRIFRASPRGAAPAAGWPVLYMLDGTGAFDFLTPALLETVPGLVVIGLGYAGEAQFARNERVRDYTPPKTPGGAPFRDPHHGDRLAGGAEAFARALTGPLRAVAEQGLPVDPARRSLWGHSLGGLCTLYVATHHTAEFARYMPTSPSIWWDPPLFHGYVAAARFDPACPTRIHLGLGDREQRTGSEGPPPAGPSPVTMDLAERLRATPGVDFTHAVFEGAIHIAALPASQPEALRLAAL